MAPSSKKKSRTTVPVASRDADRRAAARAAVKDRAEARTRLDILGWGILVFALIIVLVAVAMPLNNYYQGRAEIARLNEAIAAKSAEKERLLTEIDKYRSESYIEQEARRRLGVVKPGETAYRILDPKMTHDSAVTTDKTQVEDSRDWYTVLWDSFAEPPVDNGAVSDSPNAAETGESGEISEAVSEAVSEQQGPADAEGAHAPAGPEGAQAPAEPAAQ